MAWIVKLPPTPRHPQTRWQVRYRDGTTQRSAGIYPTKAEAGSVQRAIEHRDHVAYSDLLSPDRASMLFAEYVTMIWSGACLETRPSALARGARSKLTARILPRFLQHVRWAIGLPLGTWTVRRALLTEGAQAQRPRPRGNQSPSPEPVPSG